VSCATAERLFRTGFKCDRRDADKVLNFRINVVDLGTGFARDMTLTLPFEGRIPERDEKPTADPGCPQGFGAPEFQIGIDELEREGNTLRVVIRTGKLQTAVEFDLESLLKRSHPGEP